MLLLSGIVTLDLPAWAPEWHAPFLKVSKSAIHANRDDTDDPHSFVDDLLTRLQDRMAKGECDPSTFKVLFTAFTDHLDRASLGVALVTLQTFGVRTGRPFSSYLLEFRAVVESEVKKGAPDDSPGPKKR